MFWCLVLGHPATLRDPRSPCAQERLWVPRTAQGRLGAGRCESLQLEKTAARFFLPGNPDLCQEGEVPTGPPPQIPGRGQSLGGFETWRACGLGKGKARPECLVLLCPRSNRSKERPGPGSWGLAVPSLLEIWSPCCWPPWSPFLQAPGLVALHGWGQGWGHRGLASASPLWPPGEGVRLQGWRL